MDFGHWEAMRSAMRDTSGGRRRVDRATLRRVAGFARPHRRSLVAFLVLSSIVAFLTVATPVLAGWVVDEIVATDGSEGRVVWLAVIIALVAVAEAVVGLGERWYSARNC